MRYEVEIIARGVERRYQFSSLAEAKKLYRSRRTYYKAIGEIALHDLKTSKTLLSAGGGK